MKKRKFITDLFKNSAILICTLILISTGTDFYAQGNLSFPVVDTGQDTYYNNTTTITAPLPGSSFYGQDATYSGFQPSYTDNSDGTVSDNISGLMWAQTPDLDNDGDIDYNDKMSYAEAMLAADTFSLAGYTDWRLPSIKEMYSLIQFDGVDPSGYQGTSTAGLTPFIDTNYFAFGYGDQSVGERIIDAQLASSTLYVSTTMVGNQTMFGVNFADGRIKGYPTGPMPGQTVDKQFYVMFVRGNTSYGINSYQNNNDSTITDNATDLMWTKYDDGQGMLWEASMSYAENATVAGYSDWRLPNAKELQSIIDYTRSPATSNSAAIDSVFNCTVIIDEGGGNDYPFYWSGTTHANMSTNNSGAWGAYVCFGEALGFMEMPPNSGNYTLLDVHGAGSQRSDPKIGNPADYPNGHGPQGDVVRIYNYVRLVRDASIITNNDEIKEIGESLKLFPNPVKDEINIQIPSEINGNIYIRIFSMNGQLIRSQQSQANSEITINVDQLVDGMYLLNIIGDKDVLTGRFVKR
jgi:hypothetical protein